MSKHKNNGTKEINNSHKGYGAKSWNADVQDFYPSSAAVHVATAVQYWEAAKKQKFLTTRCRKRQAWVHSTIEKKATGLLSTIRTGELQSKTGIEVFPMSLLTSPQLPGCTQAPCLILKTAAINTESYVTFVHIKCHCSGF